MHRHHHEKVFPTPVGVFHNRCNIGGFAVSLPHARGGVSFLLREFETLRGSSPRPWGCFQKQSHPYTHKPVFPTPVGVFPMANETLPASRCLPHARGGVSYRVVPLDQLIQSSPRPWGCFPKTEWTVLDILVFPTPVGVFPISPPASKECISLPHARGGVSSIRRTASHGFSSSPRPWGCFFLKTRASECISVFPTPVGVFLNGQRGASMRFPSSPRPWGCFRQLRLPRCTW